ncbi:hypothetical protein [Moorena sp. SIO3I6]|uniref:hypothetical protein n=1 Tax=Moorena sp. SIO3I6 TaxID=2607831 RepID=UPI0013FCBADE|nr:hypothetical protein [Moorena sp. SIO3I6]NEP26021.1 hypothetical protein [Moorena sp. SIO3I6]
MDSFNDNPNTITVDIHEFSTGINAEMTPDGGWISRGFTGRYMNATLDKIPYTVERAIANKRFAVVEGANSNQPAVIGRVVPGEPDLSVVAVVTRGRDDGGRPLSVYRYFLCQGADSLGKILSWMEDYAQGEGHLPVFNPFETRVDPLEEISIPLEIPSEKLEQDFRNESVPIVLSREYQYNNFRLINKIAEIKAGAEPVSWAYNAEALENPWSFVVIHPASERAYGSFLELKDNPPLAVMPATVDEQALKSAIKRLMNSSQVKSEAVLEIKTALGNQKITSDYWHRLFDGQGAQHALTQNSYTPQFVRLLTLRAMVIPETLPEFLVWFNQNDRRSKHDKNQDIFVEFQKAIGSELPPERLAKDMNGILPELLAGKITPEAVCWLLKNDKSAWKGSRQTFIDDVKTYLSENGQYQDYKQSANPLYQLSDLLKDNSLDAVLNKLGFEKQKNKPIININGFIILNKVLIKLNNKLLIKPIQVMIKSHKKHKKSNYIFEKIKIIIIIVFMAFVSNTLIKIDKQTAELSNYVKNSQWNPKMTEESKNLALKKIDVTSQSIQDILKELVNDTKLKPKLEKNKKELKEDDKPYEPDDQVANAIKEILQNQDLQYPEITKNKKEKEKWVQAIYKYQKSQRIIPNGIILKPNVESENSDYTYNILMNQTKEHLLKKLNKQNQQ